jgi:hypothetical protein
VEVRVVLRSDRINSLIGHLVRIRNTPEFDGILVVVHSDNPPAIISQVEASVGPLGFPVVSIRWAPGDDSHALREALKRLFA